MNSSVLFEIERKIRELSQKEQSILENQLAAMTSDPEIQRELKKIGEEVTFDCKINLN